jgi:hypothetical protein
VTTAIVCEQALGEAFLFPGMAGAQSVRRPQGGALWRSGSRLQKPTGLRELLRARIFLFAAAFEAEAIAVHLQNVDMMG